jgi:hypothetical protein
MPNIKTIHGMSQGSQIKNVLEISVKKHFEIDEDFEAIVNELTTILITKMISSKQIHFVKIHSDYTNQYSATVNICKPGLKFTTIWKDKFIIDGESFTEEDVIKSLKMTSPERFI